MDDRIDIFLKLLLLMKILHAYIHIIFKSKFYDLNLFSLYTLYNYTRIKLNY